MLYQKMTVKNGQPEVVESKMIDQSSLTDECWIIQMDGPKACEKCEYRDTEDCGGKELRKYFASQPKSVRFIEHLGGGDGNEKWVSNKLNNRKFDYWLVLEITDLEVACGDPGAKYLVTLNAVAPSQVGESEIKSALASWGLEKPWSEYTDTMKVEILQSYGSSACVWQGTGNNQEVLLKKGRSIAQSDGYVNFNSFLRKFANQIGHTNMDFLRGDLSYETAEKNVKAAMQ
jgi:hypothetical protein